MNDLHDATHGLHRGIRQDAVAEIENVAGATAHPRQHVPDARLETGPGSE
jgi:hypothetical protein